jgi:hypothetical protein
VSGYVGSNEIEYAISNTVNPSLGAAPPPFLSLGDRFKKKPALT